MSLDVKVPKISEEEKSGVIIRWYRSEGDQVKMVKKSAKS